MIMEIAHIIDVYNKTAEAIPYIGVLPTQPTPDQKSLGVVTFQTSNTVLLRYLGYRSLPMAAKIRGGLSSDFAIEGWDLFILYFLESIRLWSLRLCVLSPRVYQKTTK